MPRYVAAFDDSGANGPLVKPDGSPGSRDGFLTLVAGAIISADAEEQFESDWNGLRDDIADSLGLAAPPAIHLRLMWGKKLPAEHRGQANPYRAASFDEIRGWVGRAWGIIGRYVDERQGGWFTNFGFRDAHIEEELRYTRHPKYAAELEHLRRALGPCFKRYSNLLHSSILPLYTQSLVYLDDLMLATRSDADVLFDSWSEARSIDLGTTISSAVGLLSLDRIRGTVAVPDPDSSALMQMADLVAYTKAREIRATHGNIQPDHSLAELVTVSDGHRLTIANTPHRIKRRYGSVSRMSIPIHFAVARRFVEDCRPDVAEDQLKTMEEFVESFAAEIETTPEGVSVLTPSAAASAAIMAKTPV